MEIQLIDKIDNNLSVVETVLKNRGIPVTEINHYLNTTDADIESYEDFGKIAIEEAAKTLVKHIHDGSRTMMIVD